MNFALDLSLILAASTALVGVGAFLGSFRQVASMRGQVDGLKSRLDGIGASVTRAHDVGYKTAAEVTSIHQELHKGIQEITTLLHGDRAIARETNAKLEIMINGGFQELRHDIREIRLDLRRTNERMNLRDYPGRGGGSGGASVEDDRPRAPGVRSVK